MRWIFLAAASFVPLAACAGKGGCDTRSQNNVCIDYEGPADIVAPYEKACATWLADGCPKTDRVGGCFFSDDRSKLRLTQWAYPPNTKASVEQGCTGGGYFLEP